MSTKRIEALEADLVKALADLETLQSVRRHELQDWTILNNELAEHMDRETSRSWTRSAELRATVDALQQAHLLASDGPNARPQDSVPKEAAEDSEPTGGPSTSCHERPESAVDMGLQVPVLAAKTPRVRNKNSAYLPPGSDRTVCGTSITARSWGARRAAAPIATWATYTEPPRALDLRRHQGGVEGRRSCAS